MQTIQSIQSITPTPFGALAEALRAFVQDACRPAWMRGAAIFSDHAEHTIEIASALVAGKRYTIKVVIEDDGLVTASTSWRYQSSLSCTSGGLGSVTGGSPESMAAAIGYAILRDGG